MDAITFLLEEHNQVRKMFSEIERKSHSDVAQRKLFSKLCQDLLVHEKMEQIVWYPRFDRFAHLQDILKHLRHEEQEAQKSIKEFEGIKTHEEWEKKFLKFKKEVDHHAGEEENKLFPKVRSVLTEAELDILGSKMAKFKEDYKLTPSEQITIKAFSHNSTLQYASGKLVGFQEIGQKLKSIFNDIFR